MIIFNKFKEIFGGRVRFIISGGAPLSSECSKLLRICFGIPVIQGYALTETTGGATIQELDDNGIGVVGPPIPNVQIRLIDVPEMNYSSKDPNPSGEILIRGPTVSVGYFEEKEKTDEVYKDGWFYSGDIGRILPNGTLKIIDRKKNLIKPPHGEYIAVERLESVYKNCIYVENICVYASSEKNELLAFISPNKKNLTALANKEKINFDSFEHLCENQDIRKLVVADLSKVANQSGLRSIEKINSVKLYPEEWTPENGMLTAAMKIKRFELYKKFKKT